MILRISVIGTLKGDGFVAFEGESLITHDGVRVDHHLRGSSFLELLKRARRNLVVGSDDKDRGVLVVHSSYVNRG